MLSRAKACKIVGFSRSALYKPLVNWASKDAPVIDALNEVVAKRPRWGFWKCFHRLRGDGQVWNHKRVHRVYCAMKLNLQRKAKKRLITRERQPLTPTLELNRVWALDFMRYTMYDGRPFRTLNVIDEGNREALRIECGTSIPSARLVRVMNQLIEVYGQPEAIRMDNGPEMTSTPSLNGRRREASSCSTSSLANLIRTRLSNDSTRASEMRCLMPICSTRSPRRKPLRTIG